MQRGTEAILIKICDLINKYNNPIVPSITTPKPYYGKDKSINLYSAFLYCSKTIFPTPI